MFDADEKTQTEGCNCPLYSGTGWSCSFCMIFKKDENLESARASNVPIPEHEHGDHPCPRIEHGRGQMRVAPVCIGNYFKQPASLYERNGRHGSQDECPWGNFGPTCSRIKGLSRMHLVKYNEKYPS
jgi:hypothetical protein